MTLPIPPGAPRKRKEKACVSCRTAKVKCLPNKDHSTSDTGLSVDAENQNSPRSACSRCARLALTCNYAPSRRLGRPRRKEKLQSPPSDAQSTSSSSKSQESSSISQQEIQATSIGVDPANSIIGTNPSNNHSESGPSVAPVDPLNFPVTLFNQQPRQDFLPLLITPDGQINDNHFFIAILNEYKHNVHHYIPVLPSDELNLELSIRTAPPFLMSAILKICFPLSSLSSLDDEPEIPEINPTLTDIQAAALLTLVYHGRGEARKAQVVLSQASNCLIGLRATFLEMESSDEARTPTVDASTLEMWRRVWWECWGLEIFLYTVTCVPHMITLGKEDYKPKLPCGYTQPGETPDIDNSDTVFVQAMALMYEVIQMNDLHSNLIRLVHFSNIGSNLFTLARQQWALTTSTENHLLSSTSTSELKRFVSRERSLFSALVAAGSVIFLHSTVFGPIIYESGDDDNPQPGTANYLRKTSQSVFNFLRDSINFYTSTALSTTLASVEGGTYGSSPPQHSPFFACTQRIAAMGSFFALTRSPALQTQDANAELVRASLATDFQLAETAIIKQCSRWQNSEFMANEIKILRGKMQGNITDCLTRVLIGAA